MKDDKVYLQKILESILKIEKYTNKGKEEFMNSDLIQDAVNRNLQIIGEATKKISQVTTENNTKRSHGGKWQDYAMC